MHVCKFIYVHLYDRRCKSRENIDIEREIRVIFMQFETKENLGKTSLDESSKAVASLG